jgi:hypothetical protein
VYLVVCIKKKDLIYGEIIASDSLTGQLAAN